MTIESALRATRERLAQAEAAAGRELDLPAREAALGERTTEKELEPRLIG